MRKPLRIHKTWLVTLAITVIVLGIMVSILVFATGDSRLTIAAYSDLIRFQAEGVATLQVRIFDLSGREVWDSGVVSGWTVDWDRRNDTGERLAYGAYIYSAQGWNAEGDLNFQKNGKLALMPGDKVQLQAAPAVSLPSGQEDAPPFQEPSLTPMAIDVNHSTETWLFGKVLVGTTDDTGTARLKVNAAVSSAWDPQFLVTDGTSGGYFKVGEWMSGSSGYLPNFTFHSAGINGFAGGFVGELSSGQDVLNNKAAALVIQGQREGNQNLSHANLFMVRNYATPYFTIDVSGKVGIGTTSPSATLEVHGSATNLLALYDPVAPTDPKFRVTKTGEVRADGAYYSGAGDCNTGGFNAGGADVAERINTSEWVEPGNVVEIDPEHPGFFRKASSPYSTKVAGIISTSPGVILGNSFNDATDDWEDNRPVLAVTGRVPCKVSAENGLIEIGDLLVASSTPGVAMKGNPEEAIGAVVGKAMEPLEDGEGTIVVQVLLR